jgi:8-oxo-dGTP pyrophosphatase MutT (NUDIX family)
MIIKTEENGKNNVFHILARGIVIDGDYILVAKLKNGNNTFLPGGHLEYNENLKKALEREIFEEIGINCVIGEYIACLEAQWVENENFNQEINHIFMVNGINKNMEIKSLENHLDIFWIKICEEEMEKENLLPYSMRTIVKNIHNKNNRINYISEIE